MFAHTQVLIDSGLMPAEICTDVTKKSYHYLDEAAKRIKRDQPETRELLRRLAERRGISTEPISRLALWRACAANELPKKRVRRLGAMRDLPADTAPHFELGWFNLDDLLAREFGLK